MHMLREFSVLCLRGASVSSDADVGLAYVIGSIDESMCYAGLLSSRNAEHIDSWGSHLFLSGSTFLRVTRLQSD